MVTNPPVRAVYADATTPAFAVLPTPPISASHAGMEDKRIDAALARIGAALSRAEAAAAKAPPAGLSARHEKLREAVQASLRQLDDIVGAAR